LCFSFFFRSALHFIVQPFNPSYFWCHWDAGTRCQRCFVNN
jgi:hypothetical protein